MAVTTSRSDYPAYDVPPPLIVRELQEWVSESDPRSFVSEGAAAYTPKALPVCDAVLLGIPLPPPTQAERPDAYDEDGHVHWNVDANDWGAPGT